VTIRYSKHWMPYLIIAEIIKDNMLNKKGHIREVVSDVALLFILVDSYDSRLIFRKDFYLS
jgi:hypothetical protein